MSGNKHGGVALLVACLVLLAGCSQVLGTAGQTATETAVTETETATATETATRTATETPTEVPYRLASELDEMAVEVEDAIRDSYAVESISITRPAGTANLTVDLELPEDISQKAKKELFLNTMGTVSGGQRIWVEDVGSEYRANYITLKVEEFGSATISKAELRPLVNGYLDRQALIAYWTGKLDPYTEVGNKRLAEHDARAERLNHTADLVERRLENDNEYVQNVVTEIHNETLFIQYDRTKKGPNDLWAKEEVVTVYANVVTEFGLAYTPEQGVVAHQYERNRGPWDFSFEVKNIWVFEEYVGLKGTGEASFEASRSLTDATNATHQGRP